jgi:LAO/AO transport system kinase
MQGIFDFNPDRKEKEPLIVKTIASEKKGLEDLTEKILYVHSNRTTAQKLNLLTQKAYQLIIQKKMKSISKDELSHQISLQIEGPQFNLYKFIALNYPDKL